MKKKTKTGSKTKKTRVKRSAKRSPKHYKCRSMFEPIISTPPSIVLDLGHYDEIMEQLAALRKQVEIGDSNLVHERASNEMKARAAEHRYAVATAALEQANGQIIALKGAVTAFAHSTDALSNAVQPAKIDRGQPKHYEGASVDMCAKAPEILRADGVIR